MQCMPMNMIMVRLYRICQSKFYHLLVNFYYVAYDIFTSNIMCSHFSSFKI